MHLEVKMDSSKAIFRHVIDDGLASIIEMETGIFKHKHNQNQYPFVSRPLQKKPSYKNVSLGCFDDDDSSSSPPRSPGTAASSMRSLFVYGRFFEDRNESQSHFLDYCFLCKKQIGGNKDIFMYRGDTPFCSEECRQEQIEMDEAKEKSRNLSASIRAMRKKDQIKSPFSSSSTKSTKKCSFQSSTVAAA